MARPTQEERFEWRTMVRLPAAMGQEVEQIAEEELTPPAVLLRRWINERLVLERQRRRERECLEKQHARAEAEFEDEYGGMSIEALEAQLEHLAKAQRHASKNKPTSRP
jgi:hypothetical protein